MDEHNKKQFDLSKSAREDLICKSNESRLGSFKDELNSMAMTECVALNPKCNDYRYQLINLAIDKVKISKGVSKAMVKKLCHSKQTEKY